MGEFDYIRWVREQLRPHRQVLVGPGDDAAVLVPPMRPLLVTTDLLTEGVDFVLAEAGAFAIGRKAMAVNLSDIAAMAGVPRAAVVAVALPRTAGRSVAEDLFHGLQTEAERFDVPIVGGDTNTWDGGLVVTVTLLGEATARGAVTRSGARPGDAIFVTGPCGGSFLGRHLSPKPRIREALALHEAVDLHAMIDVSDGLAADLHHILTESQCGAELSETAIPVHPDAIRRATQTGRSPVAHALSDGEDFELIFTVAPDVGERLMRDPPVPGLVWIGQCVDAGLWLRNGETRRPLAPTGWVHVIEGN